MSKEHNVFLRHILESIETINGCPTCPAWGYKVIRMVAEEYFVKKGKKPEIIKTD